MTLKVHIQKKKRVKASHHREERRKETNSLLKEGKVIINKKGKHTCYNKIKQREKKSSAYSPLLRRQGAHHACSYSQRHGQAIGCALGTPVPLRVCC